jgi:hypothetical protein
MPPLTGLRLVLLALVVILMAVLWAIVFGTADPLELDGNRSGGLTAMR